MSNKTPKTTHVECEGERKGTEEYKQGSSPTPQKCAFCGEAIVLNSLGSGVHQCPQPQKLETGERLGDEEAAWKYFEAENKWLAKDEYYQKNPEKVDVYRAVLFGIVHARAQAAAEISELKAKLDGLATVRGQEAGRTADLLEHCASLQAQFDKLTAALEDAGRRSEALAKEANEFDAKWSVKLGNHPLLGYASHVYLSSERLFRNAREALAQAAKGKK